ncbi:hypothetical protein ACVWYK_004126 [Bradyrhizobium sp. USDA 4470]
MPDDGRGIGRPQPFDQRMRDRLHRHLRDVIEHDLELGMTNALDDLAVGGINAVVADVLVVERRQHHHGVDPDGERVAGQRDGVGERSDAGARQQLVRPDAAGDHGLQQRGAFGNREGVRFARGAEHRNGIATFVQEIAAVRDEARMIGRKLGVERCQRGGEHAKGVQGLRVQGLGMQR